VGVLPFGSTPKRKMTTAPGIGVDVNLPTIELYPWKVGVELGILFWRELCGEVKLKGRLKLAK